MAIKFLMTVMLSCLLAACSNARPPQRERKVLIVYLSRTNNTKAIAEIIRDNVGGKLVGIELVKPYPEDYKAIVQQVREEAERDYLPPLRTQIDSLQSFDIVFIGFPTWGMKIPRP